MTAGNPFRGRHTQVISARRGESGRVREKTGLLLASMGELGGKEVDLADPERATYLYSDRGEEVERGRFAG